MRLNFLLPDFSRQPVGGLKVQYEFANRLSEMGHDVAIYHSVNFDRHVFSHPRSIPGLVRWNLRGGRMLEWFPLRPTIRCRFVPFLVPRLLRSADVTIFNSFLIADRIPPNMARAGRLLEVVYEYPVWKCGTEELRLHLARSLHRDDIGHIAGSKSRGADACGGRRSSDREGDVRHRSTFVESCDTTHRRSPSHHRFSTTPRGAQGCARHAPGDPVDPSSTSRGGI